VSGRYVKELVSEFERKLETETGLRTRLDDGNTDTKAKGHEERRQLEEDIGTLLMTVSLYTFLNDCNIIHIHASVCIYI
jgi:hypothetical protein